MKKGIILVVSMSFLAFGCVTTGVSPQKTQLEIREFQTREFDTKDFKMVMKALLNVLQDDGFIVKNADTELGLLQATKEVDVENESEKTTAIAQMYIPIVNMFGSGEWKKNQIIECSCNISGFGDQTRVRVNFQAKTMNNFGDVKSVQHVQDETFYQEFFSKVDKGIFIQKENL